MKKSLLIVALLIGSMTGIANADRPLVSEEPTILVQKGEVRLDAGTTYSRENGAKVLSIGETQLKTGVSTKSEVFVRDNYLLVRDGDKGFTPLTVGAKYVLTPGVAVVVSTSTPTGRYGGNGYEPGVVLALGRSLRPGTNLIANLGYRRSNFGSTRSNTAIGTLALTQDTSKGRVFAEIYGTADKNQSESFAGAVGIAHRVGDRVTLDARIGRSFRNLGEPNYFVGVGFTVLR